MTDYRDLLGDQALDLPSREEETSSEDGEDGEGDVSLITGKVRTSKPASHLHSEGQLTVINDKTIRSVWRPRTCCHKDSCLVWFTRMEAEPSWRGESGPDWSRSWERRR